MTPTAQDPPEPADGVVDERLSLIFTCCHPALALEGRVALTLRTLAQRLVRAKPKIRDAGIPFRVPPRTC